MSPQKQKSTAPVSGPRKRVSDSLSPEYPTRNCILRSCPVEPGQPSERCAAAVQNVAQPQFRMLRSRSVDAGRNAVAHRCTTPCLQSTPGSAGVPLNPRTAARKQYICTNSDSVGPICSECQASLRRPFASSEQNTGSFRCAAQPGSWEGHLLECTSKSGPRLRASHLPGWSDEFMEPQVLGIRSKVSMRVALDGRSGLCKPSPVEK
jgi:hypothetical protein